MGAVTILLFQLLLFSRGFQADYIELQILTAFEIVLLIMHTYHLIFLMYYNEARTLHELTKPPHCAKATLYFSIITLLDTLVASYCNISAYILALTLLVSLKRDNDNTMSIFELPYGIIVLVNLLFGMLVSGLVLFLFSHLIFNCAKSCKPNLQYRKVRVLRYYLPFDSLV